MSRKGRLTPCTINKHMSRKGRLTPCTINKHMSRKGRLTPRTINKHMSRRGRLTPCTINKDTRLCVQLQHWNISLNYREFEGSKRKCHFLMANLTTNINYGETLRVNNFTNIMKMNNHLSPQIIEHINATPYYLENLDPGLWEGPTCGVAIPVNGIPFPLLIIIRLQKILFKDFTRCVIFEHYSFVNYFVIKTWM